MLPNLAGMPSATFTHSAAAGGPPEEVWDRLQLADAWASIGPIEKVWDPVHVDGRLASFRWRTTVGRNVYQGSFVVVAGVRPHTMGLELDAGEITGRLAVRLEPGDLRGTLVAVTLAVASGGLSSTLLFPAIARAIGQGFPAQVEGFTAGLTR